MKRICIFLLVFLMTTSTGCAHFRQQTDDQPIAPKIDMDDAKKTVWTSEVAYKEIFKETQIKTIRAQLQDGRPWSELAISDKGEIFGFAPSNNGKPGELIVYDLYTGKTHSLYDAKDDFSIIFFKFNDNYLAWTEDTNYVASSPRIVVYDRKQRKTMVVSDSKGLPSGTSYEMIALGNDYLLWSTSDRENDKIKYKIMRYDFPNQRITLFRESAAEPIIGKDFIAWLEPDEQMKYSEIYFNDLKDHSIHKIITPDQHPRYIDTDGSSIVFTGFSATNPDIKTLSIYDPKKTPEIQIINRTEWGYYDFPQISPDFVGWRGASKVRVYSREDAKTIIFAEEYGDCTEVKLSNKFLMWHSPVIKNVNEDKLKAIEQKVFLSNLHIFSKEGISK